MLVLVGALCVLGTLWELGAPWELGGAVAPWAIDVARGGGWCCDWGAACGVCCCCIWGQGAAVVWTLLIGSFQR